MPQRCVCFPSGLLASGGLRPPLRSRPSGGGAVFGRQTAGMRLLKGLQQLARLGPGRWTPGLWRSWQHALQHALRVWQHALRLQPRAQHSLCAHTNRICQTRKLSRRGARVTAQRTSSGRDLVSGRAVLVAPVLRRAVTGCRWRPDGHLATWRRLEHRLLATAAHLRGSLL